MRGSLVAIILLAGVFFSIAAWVSKTMTTPEQLTTQGFILLGCGLLTMASVFLEP